MIKHEPESTGPADLDPESASIAARIQHLFDSFVADAPAPDLRVPLPVPTGPDGGVRMPWLGADRPAERSYTFTDPTSSAPMWRALVYEVANGWAQARRGASAGLCFLNYSKPKPRFIYWPKAANLLLASLRVSYGYITDLVTVLARFGVKLDLKGAYRHILITDEDVPFLGAVVDGLWICFNRLPFGLGPAPAIFVLTLAVTLRRARAESPGLLAAISAFVDDVGSSATTTRDLLLAVERLVQALIHDGWWLSIAKAFLRPVSNLYFTGMVALFGRGEVGLHPSKTSKLLDLLRTVRLPTAEVISAAWNDRQRSYFPTVAASAVINTAQGARVAVVSLPWATLPHPRSAVSRAVPDVRIIHTTTNPPLHLRSHNDIVASVADDNHAANLVVAGAIRDANAAGTPSIIFADPSHVSSIWSILDPHTSRVLFITDDPDGPHSLLTATTGPRNPWSAEDIIPPHLRDDNYRPLPDLDSIPPPDLRYDLPSLAIDKESFVALRSALGIVSWFQTTLGYLGFWRRAVDTVIRTSTWTPEAVDSVVFLATVTPLLHRWTRPVRPRPPTLTVVVDSGSAGWGAILDDPSSGRRWYLAGILPVDVLGAASGVREAAGARAPIRRAFALGIKFLSVHVILDATATIGAASGGMRSLAFAPVLMSFAAYEIQGITMHFSHEGRECGEHPQVDALSAAAAPPAWTLLPEILNALTDIIGPLDVHLDADDASSIAPSYTTPTPPSAERAAVLAAIPTASTAGGWIGTTEAFEPDPRTTVVCFPRWSRLPLIMERWSSLRFSLLLIAPTTPDEWWGPSVELAAGMASSVWLLPPQASQPPVDRRPAGFRADPRRLSAYWLPSPHWRLRPPPSPPGPRAELIRYGSRLGTPAQLSYVLGGHCPKDRPPKTDPSTTSTPNTDPITAWCTEHHLLPTPPRPAGVTPTAPRPSAPPPQVPPHLPPPAPPTTTAPPPAPTPAAPPLPTPPLPPTHRLLPSASAPATTPATDTSCSVDLVFRSICPPPTAATAAPQPTPPSLPQPPSAFATTPADPDAIWPLLGAAPPQAGGAGEPQPQGTHRRRRDITSFHTAHPLPVTDAASTAHPLFSHATNPSPTLVPATVVTTIGRWIDLVIGFREGTSAGIVHPSVPAALHAPIASAATAVRLKATRGSHRNLAAPRKVRQTAVAYKVLGAPATLPAIEALVLTYVWRRLMAPLTGWRPMRLPSSARSDASAVSAASERAGVPLPPHCGIRVGAYLSARCGAQREHSTAYPVHIRDIYLAEPSDPASEEWETWAASLTLSAFTLRPGILFLLTAAMFVTWRGGKILVWRFISKRAGGDVLDPSLTCNVIHVSAARFPDILRIFANLPSTGRLFPRLTTTKLNTFVRKVAGRERVPASFTVRSHGERVSAAIDHKVLGVNEDDTNVSFWWKRQKRSTAFYYSGTNCETLMRVCEARFNVTVRHFGPGFFDAVVNGPVPDWKAPFQAPAEGLPPIASIVQELDAAYAAELPDPSAGPQADNIPTRVTPPVHSGNVDATTLPNAPPEGSPDGSDSTDSDFEGSCARCQAAIPVGTQALLCNRKGCQWGLCVSCEPDLTRTVWCPAHTRAPRASTRR